MNINTITTRDGSGLRDLMMYFLIAAESRRLFELLKIVQSSSKNTIQFGIPQRAFGH
jgi:hypothetical protein